MLLVRLGMRYGWLIIWICNLVVRWVGLNMVRIGVCRVLMGTLMGGNSLSGRRSNLIRVTVRVRVYLMLDYGGTIRPWIV